MKSTLLVICIFTLATVGSDGQQSRRRNAINTLRESISINDINNFSSTNYNNTYTKKIFNNNSNYGNANVNSFNATIVLPLMATYDSASSASTSSSYPSSTASLLPSPVYVAPSASKLVKSTTSSRSSTSSFAPEPTTSGHELQAAISADASVLRDKRGASLDSAEIARQNQITQQILSNYLERRLFPERSVSQKIPTIADILPKTVVSTTTPRSTRQRAKPRGFSSSSSFKRESGRRKIYGQRKSPSSSSQNLIKLKGRNQATEPALDEEEPLEEETKDSELLDVETETEESFNNKTLNNPDDVAEEEEELPEEEEQDDYDEDAVARQRHLSSHHQQHRYRHRHQQSRRPSTYHQRYSLYDDDIEQDGLESLQSVESEQHDHYYKTKGDIFARDPSENEIDSDCPHCVDETQYMNKWTMPLLKLGEKRYYLGIFFKANWFKATQYCRYHGMHLASISSQEENDRLEKHIKDFGLGHEHFWISGTDLADEGNFFWMATGRPITFTNWNAGEPNNFRYENGEEENCLELWNRDGKGLKWNDSPCSFETYFVCEVQP